MRDTTGSTRQQAHQAGDSHTWLEVEPLQLSRAEAAVKGRGRGGEAPGKGRPVHQKDPPRDLQEGAWRLLYFRETPQCLRRQGALDSRLGVHSLHRPPGRQQQRKAPSQGGLFGRITQPALVQGSHRRATAVVCVGSGEKSYRVDGPSPGAASVGGGGRKVDTICRLMKGRARGAPVAWIAHFGL